MWQCHMSQFISTLMLEREDDGIKILMFHYSFQRLMLATISHIVSWIL